MPRFALHTLLAGLVLLWGCHEQPRTQTAQQHADSLAVKVLADEYPDLIEQFNADSAKARMLVLLSPT